MIYSMPTNHIRKLDVDLNNGNTTLTSLPHCPPSLLTTPSCSSPLLFKVQSRWITSMNPILEKPKHRFPSLCPLLPMCHSTDCHEHPGFPHRHEHPITLLPTGRTSPKPFPQFKPPQTRHCQLDWPDLWFLPMAVLHPTQIHHDQTWWLYEAGAHPQCHPPG